MTLIAIDGPAGVGKTTIARALAQRLSLPHVDTGAYYRAATLVVLRAGVEPGDAASVMRVLQAATIRRTGARAFLGDEDVEDQIRGPEVTAAVSAVAAHPQVRRLLIELQRGEAAGGAVVEGRDAGTAVVPGAELKVWLTAPVEVRAHRRAAQLGQLSPGDIARHAAAIAQRDAADAKQMERAADVVEVDTHARSVDEVVATIVALAGDAVAQPATKDG